MHGQGSEDYQKCHGKIDFQAKPKVKTKLLGGAFLTDGFLRAKWESTEMKERLASK